MGALSGTALSLTPAQQNSFKTTLTEVQADPAIADDVATKLSEVKTAVTAQKSVTIVSDVTVNEVKEVVLITAAPTSPSPTTTASVTTEGTTAPDTTAAPATASASRVLGLGSSFMIGVFGLALV